MLAVTVWEMTVCARDRPYSSMNDTQVILNADHFFYADGKQVFKNKYRYIYKYEFLVF